MMMATSNVGSVLKDLETKLDELYSKAKDSHCDENESFDLEEFWKYFVSATKLLSHEATKFSMAFAKPPVPSVDDCQSLVSSIEKVTDSLVTLFISFPSCRGKTLLEEIRKFVCPVVLAVKELSLAASQRSSKNVLQTVGNVWEKCERVDSLPKDNKEAVLAVCDAEYSLVNDAVSELVDALESEAENNEEEMRHAFLQNGIRIPCPDNWSDSDRNVVIPSLGLIKACKSVLKKSYSSIKERALGDDESLMKELDDFVGIVNSSSSHVDNLASSLYPPLYRSAVIDHALYVHSNCKNLLNYLENSSHLISRAELTWVAFLHKALDHNWALINERITTD